MEYLSWDLSILSRAVAYTNLSGASAHVGLSQPQLSRIVAKLEEQFGLTLLDRETKRKSSWTPAAYRLAEIYVKAFQSFRSEVGQLADGLEPTHLRIGTLEGLIPQAMDFCHKLYKNSKLRTIELDVHDTSQLEERFLKNELDLIFSSREPGRKKFRFLVTLGYQSIDVRENQGGATEPLVYSMFEFASAAGHHKNEPLSVKSDGTSPDATKKKTQRDETPLIPRVFVSNSLQVRREWLSTYGGTGTLPSPVRPEKTDTKNEVTVIAVAHDHLPSAFWADLSRHLGPK